MHKVLLKAVIAGVLAVPLAVSAQALLYTVSKTNLSLPLLSSYVDGVLAWSLAGSAIALLLLALYGLPAFLFLRKYHLANIFSCCAVALLPSAALALISRDPILFIQYGYFSVVSALAFWLFARCIALQPNNSFKPKPLRGSA